jgi:UDP-N-acetylmuramoyl-tripeptide--D-alanyl-D-alanine ligase
MGFSDPFPGYSLLLRVIVFGILPGFAVWQLVRLRKALHVLQLEGYKRRRFMAWCRSHRRRVLFGPPLSSKRPLVMTGRAWRILVAATALSVVAILGASGAAHLAAGWPFDVAAWAATTALVTIGTPELIAVADWALQPVQSSINGRFTRAALRRLAEVDPVVIGVTGSFGKTSTKFAIAGTLEPEEAVYATPGSYNTPLGVVRAINEHLLPSHRWFVVEMGAYGRGEIAQLSDLVNPRVGVLTAIGPAHLERFGSMEAIRATKYELIESLPEQGLAVMNSDDSEVRALAEATSHVAVVRYGLDERWSPELTAADVRTTPQGTAFRVIDTRTAESVAVTTRLLGPHSPRHALAAVAVATHFGAPLEDVVRRLARLRPVEHRLQLVEGTGGVTVIDDAFNSNPEGAEAALEVLGAMPARRRVVVTPGIVELGDLQFEANRRLGQRAATVADALIVVADVNREAICAGAEDADGGVQLVTVSSLAEARSRLEDLLEPGDAVLFENDLPGHQETASESPRP